ncbi:MAG: hypothetical protein WA763_10810 [Pseudolabrys sp.]
MTGFEIVAVAFLASCFTVVQFAWLVARAQVEPRGAVMLGEIVALVFSAFCAVSFAGCICVAWGTVP